MLLDHITPVVVRIANISRSSGATQRRYAAALRSGATQRRYAAALRSGAKY